MTVHLGEKVKCHLINKLIITYSELSIRVWATEYLLDSSVGLYRSKVKKCICLFMRARTYV